MLIMYNNKLVFLLNKKQTNMGFRHSNRRKYAAKVVIIFQTSKYFDKKL